MGIVSTATSLNQIPSDSKSMLLNILLPYFPLPSNQWDFFFNYVSEYLICCCLFHEFDLFKSFNIDAISNLGLNNYMKDS